MQSDSICFDRFRLDRQNRQLLDGDAPVELSSRYFDALALLAGEAGRLVSKERFNDEVWSGVPVTDEALTQCIKTLRRALGDDATRPRFIETVPKHGYRFIAPVMGVVKDTAVARATPFDWLTFLRLGGAGVVGGGIAGLLGGIFYGFVSAAQPLGPGMGAGSTVLVLTALSVGIGLLGALGVSFGIALAMVRSAGWRWSVTGGALGGLLTGGIAKLLGLDAFNLLFGNSPSQITGAFEGAAIGGAVGLGVCLGGRNAGMRIWPAAFAGAAAGVAITSLGGKLLGGSLDQLTRIFPQSRLRLDQIGFMFGEDGFGRISQIATGALEGSLFAACVAAAILLARRQLAD